MCKARVQRDRDMLVGQLVPAEATDWSAEATVVQVVGEDADGIRCDQMRFGRVGWICWMDLVSPSTPFDTFWRRAQRLNVQNRRDSISDWSKGAPVWQETSETGRYLRYKAYDVALVTIGWYLYKTLQNRHWVAASICIILDSLEMLALMGGSRGICMRSCFLWSDWKQASTQCDI